MAPRDPRLVRALRDGYDPAGLNGTHPAGRSRAPSERRDPGTDQAPRLHGRPVRDALCALHDVRVVLRHTPLTRLPAPREEPRSLPHSQPGRARGNARSGPRRRSHHPLPLLRDARTRCIPVRHPHPDGRGQARVGQVPLDDRARRLLTRCGHLPDLRARRRRLDHAAPPRRALRDAPLGDVHAARGRIRCEGGHAPPPRVAPRRPSGRARAGKRAPLGRDDQGRRIRHLPDRDSALPPRSDRGGLRGTLAHDGKLRARGAVDRHRHHGDWSHAGARPAQRQAHARVPQREPDGVHLGRHRSRRLPRHSRRDGAGGRPIPHRQPRTLQSRALPRHRGGGLPNRPARHVQAGGTMAQDADDLRVHAHSGCRDHRCAALQRVREQVPHPSRARGGV